MKLSIVIVNYNVRHFLEQCLHSVLKACEGIESEVFVVDNNSKDDSCEMVRSIFPSVKLIANKDNPGFSIANNQAIRIAKGEYILILNPDTLVGEDTFHTCISYMDSRPNAGALGIKMVDGKGIFLPESKRGLPTPKVAFYKIFGLSNLFKNSEKYGKYHLSYLDKNENHEVEILSGAFMFMRKTALDKSGLLDETFFMYGEDIDLSYRIELAGYKNHYLADSQIIHYKGESTKKGSINYVFVFYEAMIIFAKKHFGKQNAFWFQMSIYFAIYVRAFLALIKRFFDKFTLPIIDISVIGLSFIQITSYWESNHLYIKNGGEYPDFLLQIFLPIYILIWMIGLALNGAYNGAHRFTSIARGLFIGTLTILVGYSLCPEEYRTSRALILLGAMASGVWFFMSRTFIHLLDRNSKNNKNTNKRALILANDEEGERIKQMLQISSTYSFIKIKTKPLAFESIRDLKNSFQFDELILSDSLHDFKSIISYFEEFQPEDFDYKVALKGKDFIVGSNNINTNGDVLTKTKYEIESRKNKTQKRVLDLALSLILITLSPILIVFIKSPIQFIQNMFKTFIGKTTFVSVSNQTKGEYSIPDQKPGILKPFEGNNTTITSTQINEIEYLYAKEYHVDQDIQIIIKHFKKLGRKI